MKKVVLVVFFTILQFQFQVIFKKRLKIQNCIDFFFSQLVEEYGFRTFIVIQQEKLLQISHVGCDRYQEMNKY